MLVSWKYRFRDTFIQRLDPRTRLIFMACVIMGFTIPQIWDFRLILPIFVISMTLYLLARIEWKDIRRAWFFVLVLVIFIVGLNGLLSGRGGPTSVIQEENPAILAEWTLGIPGTAFATTIQITAVKTWFALTQMTRMLAMAILALPLPYTMDPNIYGITFRRMGASDKVSFTVDLAFRFLPTLARDLSITVDAQRTRGYEMDTLKGGIIERIRRLAPLVIPVTMQSTVTGEEVIDAMDLRAFGTAERTWLKELHFGPSDYFIIALGVAIFIGLCVSRFVFGIGEFWVPDFMLALAQ